MTVTAREATNAEITRRPFTVEEYLRMAEVGILHEDDPIELIEGEIVEMSPIGTRHMSIVNRLNRLLVLLAGERYIVSVQNSMRLSDRSMPEPDFALLRPKDDEYISRHPTPSDVFLMIEVAETSLQYDLRMKAPLYARAGITDYWVVDISENVVYVFSEPQNGVYASERRAGRGETISPSSLPDLKLSVNDILP